MYWAEELEKQSDDIELEQIFTKVAQTMREKEEVILQELSDVQGNSVDIQGYFNAPEERVYEVMRPSATLNKIIDRI
jgi:isocitrate dehydrogenase